MKLIIAILLLAIGSFAQNTTYKDGTDCECDSIYIENSNSGDTEFAMKNGVRHGITRWYYKSGRLYAEDIYYNGMKNGLSTRYYESGVLNQEVPLTNNKRNGIVKWYYESGALAGTATYKNGKLAGYKRCTDGRFGNENLDCLE